MSDECREQLSTGLVRESINNCPSRADCCEHVWTGGYYSRRALWFVTSDNYQIVAAPPSSLADYLHQLSPERRTGLQFFRLVKQANWHLGDKFEREWGQIGRFTGSTSAGAAALRCYWVVKTWKMSTSGGQTPSTACFPHEVAVQRRDVLSSRRQV